MLVYTRKTGEAVVVSGRPGDRRLLTVTVLEIWGSRVRLGFDAAPEVVIDRSEVWDRKNAIVAPLSSGDGTEDQISPTG